MAVRHHFEANNSEVRHSTDPNPNKLEYSSPHITQIRCCQPTLSVLWVLKTSISFEQNE